MNIKTFAFDRGWSLSLPLGVFFFLYFSTSSWDLLQIHVGPFAVKFTHVMSLFLFFLYVFSVQRLTVPLGYLAIFCTLLMAYLLSFCQSSNPIATLGFTLFFIFNFIFYFILPLNYVKYFGFDSIFSIYRASFLFVGSYVAVQVIASTVGLYLPVAGQSIGSIVRGQALCYEPSYYALYFTPFVMYENSRYLLDAPGRKHFGWVMLYNLFFLLSTSTGCLFSYLFFAVSLVVLSPVFWRRILQFFAFIGALFAGFFWIFQSGFQMLLKFFYYGLRQGSLKERWEGILRDGSIFWEFPWTGVGAGAVSTYAQQMAYGDVDPLDPEVFQLFSSTNVTMEILASLGLFGAIGFLALCIYIVQDLSTVFHVERLTVEERSRLLSLAISLLVLFFALQFNQSVLRAYVWIHVALCVAYAHELLEKYHREPL